MFKKASSITLSKTAHKQLAKEIQRNDNSNLVTCLLFYSRLTETIEGVETETSVNGLSLCQYEKAIIPSDAIYEIDGMITAFYIVIGNRDHSITIDFQDGYFFCDG